MLNVFDGNEILPANHFGGRTIEMAYQKNRTRKTITVSEVKGDLLFTIYYLDIHPASGMNQR